MRPDLPEDHGGADGRRGRHTTLLTAAVTAVADLLGVAPDSVATGVPFSDLGLSSIQLARLTAQLEDAMGVEVTLTAIYDHPDIEQLVEHLAMR
ncbi:acyl carrier protein [Nocardia bovistercoris]|uniref:Acyl carrier protein n=1 Tax=Nocardia bovistercoris TaxID=2785916 RepID=A0A931IDK4_9NOCA|nr:acyl carrier protein [Nocardia bovistercoris]MBH0778561.1 acyl carrier protein [Nocardia bovistercoris]